jgi:hypothetical protein
MRVEATLRPSPGGVDPDTRLPGYKGVRSEPSSLSDWVCFRALIP